MINSARIVLNACKLAIMLAACYGAWVCVVWFLPDPFREFELLAKLAAVLAVLRLAELLDGRFKTTA